MIIFPVLKGNAVPMGEMHGTTLTGGTSNVLRQAEDKCKGKLSPGILLGDLPSAAT